MDKALQPTITTTNYTEIPLYLYRFQIEGSFEFDRFGYRHRLGSDLSCLFDFFLSFGSMEIARGRLWYSSPSKEQLMKVISDSQGVVEMREGMNDTSPIDTETTTIGIVIRQELMQLRATSVP